MRVRVVVTVLILVCAALCVQTTRAGVVINEFQASNDTTVSDEAGQFDDWVELYNAGSTSVNLAGWHLTDDFSKPEKWTFPDTTIKPGGFLLVWCDNDPGDGPLHATFKLDADGEQIALVDPEGNVVDSLTFGPQQTDVSYGRMPDGGTTWQAFTRPTPGWGNTVSSVAEVSGDPAAPRFHGLVQVWPNPVSLRRGNLTVAVAGRVRPAGFVLEVYDVLGRRLGVRVLRGTKTYVSLADLLGPAPPGRYFFRVRIGPQAEVIRMVVLP